MTIPDQTAAGAVERELAELAKLDPSLSTSALAMSALCLAREMDSSDNSATSKSMCGREMRDTLDRIRELAPKAETKDDLDDLRTRRRTRLAGSATA